EVVRDDTGEVGCGVSRGKDVELRQRRRLIIECHGFAVAEIATSSGERRHFLGLREQDDVVGNDTQRSHARPEFFHRGSVAFVAGKAGSSKRLRRILGIVSVVGRTDRGLIGQDENGAQAGELLGYRRDEIVTDQDVLVLLLYQLIAWGDNHFYHVLAGGQHRSAVGRVNHADRAVRTGDASR